MKIIDTVIDTCRYGTQLYASLLMHPMFHLCLTYCLLDAGRYKPTKSYTVLIYTWINLLGIEHVLAATSTVDGQTTAPDKHPNYSNRYFLGYQLVPVFVHEQQ